jgi:hypothetical protein
VKQSELMGVGGIIVFSAVDHITALRGGIA